MVLSFFKKEFNLASKSSLLIIPTVSISLSSFLITVKGIKPPSQVLVIFVKKSGEIAQVSI